MTPEQEEHIDEILDDFFDEAKPKYEIGALEHQGNLWEVPTPKLVEFMGEEVIDLVVYFYTLRPKIEALLEENKQLKQQLKDIKSSTME